MGKISKSVTIKAFFILLNTVLITFLAFYLYYSTFRNYFIQHKGSIGIAISFALFSAIVVVIYCIINQKMQKIIGTPRIYLVLLVFSFFYYLLYFHLYYFAPFMVPVFFLLCQGAVFLNKELHNVLAANIITLFIFIALLFYESPEIKAFYGIKSISLQHLFSINYFGVFHFFVVIFNKKYFLKLSGQ